MKKKHVLKLIQRAWRANPDLSLGELIHRAVQRASEAQGRGGRGGGPSVSAATDEHMHEGLSLLAQTAKEQ